MDEQLFFSPQVKQSVINNIKVGYIASQVTKRLNTWEFGKLGDTRIISKFIA